MPLQHAVLALLDERPSYGWELKSSFEAAVGPQWGLNVGHLYQVLDRLRRDDLATAETVSNQDGPERVIYRITEQGQAELHAWLATPVTRTRGYRDDFFLKLMAASRAGPAQLGDVIAAQRQLFLRELRSLTELRKAHRGDVLTEMIVEAARLHTEADLRVVDIAERRSARLLDETRTSVQAAGEAVHEQRKKPSASTRRRRSS